LSSLNTKTPLLYYFYLKRRRDYLSTSRRANQLYRVCSDSRSYAGVVDNQTIPRSEVRTFLQRPLAFFLVGVTTAIVGLLPWLITGFRLPLQNLWAVAAMPDQMPRALLPFSQYAVTLIFALILAGSALAGIVLRVLLARHPLLPARPRVVATVWGVVVLHLLATIHTATTVSARLRPDSSSNIYLAVLVAVTLLSIAVGILVLVLAACARVPLAAVALSFAAVALGPWLDSLALPPNGAYTDTISMRLSIVRWIPAILVGCVAAWSGFGTAARIAASVTALLFLWAGPAALTAISAATGTRVLATRPAEMADYALNVFTLSLAERSSLTPLLVAAVVMALGIAIRWMSLRRARIKRASQRN
jgi:hypothetical protein